MKAAQLVMGPGKAHIYLAGAGKSSYSNAIIAHSKRQMHLVNLDPANTQFNTQPTIDIAELCSLQDAMEGCALGPNGGLIWCLEYLLTNEDWFREQLENYEDDYLVIDLPGQIELYSHSTIVPRLVSLLHSMDYRVVGVYLMDCQFVCQTEKFFQGVLTCMSAMLQLGIPHINLLSKMDLLLGDAIINEETNKDDINDRNRNGIDMEVLQRYLEVDTSLINTPHSIHSNTKPNANTARAGGKYATLTDAIVNLIDEYNMVHFIPLDIASDESMDRVLYEIDNSMQYGEDLEPTEPKDLEEDDDEY